MTPASLEDFVDLVVPILQERGAYKARPLARHLAREAVRPVAAGVYAIRAEACRDLFHYTEGFYNPRRLHSALGYISPSHAEKIAA